MASAGGCGTSNSADCGADCDSGSPLPSFIPPYGTCNVIGGYAVAKAVDCPHITCPKTYYAICNGTDWVACDCSLPEAGTLIPDPTFDLDAGVDSGPGYDASIDAELDSGEDAGQEAGRDGGADGGHDGGHDGGSADAGTDASKDAGGKEAGHKDGGGHHDGG